MKILSGSEAKFAWAKGVDTVEVKIKNEWVDVLKLKGMKLSEFDDISNKFRIKPKLETIEILPPKKVVLDAITGSVGLVYGDINVAKEQTEAIVKQLNVSMNTESIKGDTPKEAPEELQENWQPDWSVAPDDMLYFAVDENSEGWFFNREPHIESDNCWYCGDDAFKIDHHNYQGDWKQSLRERPEIPKVEVKPKQHSCNCPHWKGSGFFMGDTFTCKDCGGVVTI